ncbi:MAG: DUF1868 domain-containing protein [Limnospira sp. PMC 1291.21]|nr:MULTISPECIES: DUF1868 domain-containing protein [Limnospira]EKD11304.1 hypothetical protein SPLC1_S031340 [Arthrospira platensis C1]MDC0838122.1 DUF1868 domain-containing protein [Limnoraphis robusta]MDY7052813.1 DUF1868 domain-containing protein [Limnospira fusiformis LS22]QJB27495.1 DUF1868 domain-containing protein [Limnospira fusiformis SAG 85.79]MDT9179033.1 DUF1868 domain-containing protein [Limnospira sp. PMC 1238.20]
MDDNYQTYVNRVARMTLGPAYLSQLEHIQESPKFTLDAQGQRKPVPFPGYSVITPPAGEDVDNADFYQNLTDCQQQLARILDPDFFVKIPPDSLHFTLADLIWDDLYRDASQQIPDFESKVQEAIAESFTIFESQKISQPFQWQVLGLMVMTRAIVVCLVPRDEEAYNLLIQFRRSIYQNRSLMALGIEQQYHLVAHVTLGYFGSIPNDLDRETLSQQIFELNHQWLDNPQEILIKKADFRKFEDMMAYRREAHWPRFVF